MSIPHDGRQRQHAAPRQPDRIETGRLVLRRFERADAPAIVAQLADREMSWHLGRVPHPYTLDHAASFLARSDVAEGSHAVTLRGGALIGACRISPTGPTCSGEDGDGDGRVVTLGYWIGRAHWGHGYAPEAVAAKLFEHFGRGGGTVHARAFQDNPRSLAVLRHAGFKLVGEASDTNLVREGPQAVWLTECTAENFRDAPWNRDVGRVDAA